MSTKVSIIIPTYNREELLPIAIDSVINQTFLNWELLIIDDGSTDGTEEVARPYCNKDKRIFYFYKENGGQGSARNFGIKKSTGQYVLCLDSDDILLNGMISGLLEHIEQERCDVVACPNWIVSLENKAIENIGGSNPSCILYRRELFNKFCYYNEARDLEEDTDLDFQWRIIQVTQNKSIFWINIDIPLVVYLRHQGQMTANHSDVAKFRNRMNTMIYKYKNNKIIPPYWIPLKYREFGNFEILFGDPRIAREYLKQSLSLRFSMETSLLLLASYLKPRFYKIFVLYVKAVRSNIFFKLKVFHYSLRYPHLYREVLLHLS
jgi:glycosyltransferase involved in cell wall biosynthesis